MALLRKGEGRAKSLLACMGSVNQSRGSFVYTGQGRRERAEPLTLSEGVSL